MPYCGAACPEARHTDTARLVGGNALPTTAMSIRSVIRMAKILAVCISEKKGTQKHEVPEIQLKVDHGIVGDAMPATGIAR